MSESGFDDANLDATVTDTDGDGFFDTVEADTDGDGYIDTVGYDTDSDGVVDNAEVEPTDDARTSVQVFVRDRGRGFDLASIADDRMGVRGSIIGRMERHGGTARVRSAPGEGTEIRLEMTR